MITPRLRDEVFERQHGLCLLCSRGATQLHHMVPRSQLPGKRLEGLRDSIGNLVALCDVCHTDKVEAHDKTVEIMGIMRHRYGYDYSETAFRPWACEL